jgi:hypothetical protein
LFGDEGLRVAAERVHAACVAAGASAGDVYSVLLRFAGELRRNIDASPLDFLERQIRQRPAVRPAAAQHP